MDTHLWPIIVKQVHTLHEALSADLAQASMEEWVWACDIHVTTRQTYVCMEVDDKLVRNCYGIVTQYITLHHWV